MDKSDCILHCFTHIYIYRVTDNDNKNTPRLETKIPIEVEEGFIVIIKNYICTDSFSFHRLDFHRKIRQFHSHYYSIAQNLSKRSFRRQSFAVCAAVIFIKNI